MKRLGTITMWFPHIDEHSRTIIETIMDDAENYADFTERLSNRVFSESSSKLLEYLSILFLYDIGDYSMIEKLDAVGKVPSLALPLFLTTRLHEGHNVSWDEMKISLQDAIKAAPNDWIATHVYMTWRITAGLYYPETDVDIKPLELVRSSIAENNDLAVFRSDMLCIDASSHIRDNKIGEAMALLQEALTIAKDFDDQVLEAEIQVEIASYIKHSNLDQALDLFKSAKKLCEHLGSYSLIGSIHHELGHIMTIRGEYDEAIKQQLLFMNILDSTGQPTVFVNSVLAFQYNQIGDGENALKYVKLVLDLPDSIDRRLSFIRAEAAWALLNLGRYDEAKDELANAQEMALKSGHVGMLLHCKLVEGIIDKIEQRKSAAISCFQQVLNSIENEPNMVYQNICLLNLTEIEIDMFTEESLDSENEVSGPWMMKLIEHAEGKNLPGIIARAKILKARLRYFQGRNSEVGMLLEDVRNSARNPSMKYLESLIQKEFPDTIV